MTEKEIQKIEAHAEKCGGKQFDRHHEYDMPGDVEPTEAVYRCRKCKQRIRVRLRKSSAAA